jgi:hypothetical protein
MGMPEPVGKTIGQYQIVEEIGRGGMASVYKAWQTALQRHVALKVLTPQFTFDPQSVARFQREARAAALFSHPNIVAIQDTGEVDGLHSIAMEYLEGGSLQERLAGRYATLFTGQVVWMEAEDDGVLMSVANRSEPTEVKVDLWANGAVVTTEAVPAREDSLTVAGYPEGEGPVEAMVMDVWQSEEWDTWYHLGIDSEVWVYSAFHAQLVPPRERF